MVRSVAENASKSSTKKLLRKIHLWTGLTVSLPLIIITITGIILVGIFMIKEMSNSISNAEFYKVTHDEVGELIKIKIQGLNLSSIRFPEKTSGEITMRFTNKGEILNLSLEPKTLKILKSEEGGGIEKFMVKIHSSFMIETGKIGENLVGFIGVFLCIMSITGLIIWIPRRGNFRNFVIPKFSLRGYMLHSNLHKTFGIWSVSFVMIIAFTGTSLVFTKQFRDFVSNFSQVRDFKKAPKLNPDAEAINVADIVKNSLEIVPNNGLMFMQIPQKPEDPYRFALRSLEYKSGKFGIMIFASKNGEILEIRHPNEYSTGEKFILWLGYLHKGNGMGVLWRLSQIIFGGAILLFIITGFMIWRKKGKL